METRKELEGELKDALKLTPDIFKNAWSVVSPHITGKQDAYKKYFQPSSHIFAKDEMQFRLNQGLVLGQKDYANPNHQAFNTLNAALTDLKQLRLQLGQKHEIVQILDKIITAHQEFIANIARPETRGQYLDTFATCILRHGSYLLSHAKALEIAGHSDQPQNAHDNPFLMAKEIVERRLKDTPNPTVSKNQVNLLEKDSASIFKDCLTTYKPSPNDSDTFTPEHPLFRGFDVHIRDFEKVKEAFKGQENAEAVIAAIDQVIGAHRQYIQDYCAADANGRTALANKRWQTLGTHRVIHHEGFYFKKLVEGHRRPRAEEHVDREIISYLLLNVLGMPTKYMAPIFLTCLRNVQHEEMGVGRADGGIVPPLKNHQYWLQVSKKVEGQNLQHILERNPAFRPTLESFSWHFLATVLLHMNDAKADNYIVVGSETKTPYLVSIDNEDCLKPAVSQHNGKNELGIKSILLCWDDYMQQDLAPEVCQRLDLLHPLYGMFKWMWDVQNYEGDAKAWFELTDEIKKQIGFPLDVPQDFLKNVEDYLFEIKKCLKNGKKKHHDILLALCPDIAKYYEDKRKNGKDSLDVLANIYKDCEISILGADTSDKSACTSEQKFEQQSQPKSLMQRFIEFFKRIFSKEPKALNKTDTNISELSSTDSPKFLATQSVLSEEIVADTFDNPLLLMLKDQSLLGKNKLPNNLGFWQIVAQSENHVGDLQKIFNFLDKAYPQGKDEEDEKNKTALNYVIEKAAVTTDNERLLEYKKLFFELLKRGCVKINCDTYNTDHDGQADQHLKQLENLYHDSNLSEDNKNLFQALLTKNVLLQNRFFALKTGVPVWLVDEKGIERLKEKNDSLMVYQKIQEEVGQINSKINSNHQLIPADLSEKDVVIFLGYTGAGKSTLINYLMDKKLQGDARRVVLENENDQDAMPIGKDGNSCTHAAKFGVSPHNPNLLLVDLPGLFDTAGGEEDLINLAIIHDVIARAKSVRLCITASEKLFDKSNKDKLEKLLNDITQRFPGNPNLIDQSSILCVTQVPSDCGDPQNLDRCVREG